MAWVAARTWVTGEVITGDELKDVRDDLRYFKGDSVWVEPALLSAWAPYDTTTYFGPMYRKVGRVVVLRGLTKNGIFSTATPGHAGAIFTLPAGYRPPERMTFCVISNQAFGRVDIEYDTGDVVAYSGSATWLSLSGIQFPTLT
jgi:hypothetical protein